MSVILRGAFSRERSVAGSEVAESGTPFPILTFPLKA